MAPRRRNQAAQAQGVGLLSLPDDVLLRCLGHLTQQDR